MLASHMLKCPLKCSPAKKCSCTLQWTFQEPTMIEQCLNFIKTLLRTDQYITSYFAYVEKSYSVSLSVTNIAHSMLKLSWVCHYSDEYVKLIIKFNSYSGVQVSNTNSITRAAFSTFWTVHYFILGVTSIQQHNGQCMYPSIFSCVNPCVITHKTLLDFHCHSLYDAILTSAHSSAYIKN